MNINISTTVDAKVNEIAMPVSNDVQKILYKVDVKKLESISLSGIYYDYIWKTFGIYESENVAEFIADRIRNKQIIV